MHKHDWQIVFSAQVASLLSEFTISFDLAHDSYYLTYLT